MTEREETRRPGEGVAWGNVARLAGKELASLARDPVLAFLVVYAFTYAVYVPARSTGLEMRNGAVAVVDEDRSQLSRRITRALQEPWFKPPHALAPGQVGAALDQGRFTFVLDVPPDFERDVLGGRRPGLQLAVDATAMSQALVGAGYVERIVADQVADWARRLPDAAAARDAAPPFEVVTRMRFNPNVREEWYLGIIELIDNLTMLAVVLTGAALLREREHGTLEHLLVMPIRPVEIALAKILAMGAVILSAALLSLGGVVHLLLGVPIQGSVTLWAVSGAFYLFSATALGIFVATTVRSMPQFGLLMVPVIVPMIVLSGGFTPLDAQPDWLWWVMQLVPTTHFVDISTAVLARGAGLEVIWPHIAAILATGSVFLAAALWRFRSSVARS